jgi:hypothetical protein
MGPIERYREQAGRARKWAASIPDPIVRRELEMVARDYEQMAQTAESCAHRVDRRAPSQAGDP